MCLCAYAVYSHLVECVFTCVCSVQSSRRVCVYVRMQCTVISYSVCLRACAVYSHLVQCVFTCVCSVQSSRTVCVYVRVQCTVILYSVCLCACAVYSVCLRACAVYSHIVECVFTCVCSVQSSRTVCVYVRVQCTVIS